MKILAIAVLGACLAVSTTGRSLADADFDTRVAASRAVVEAFAGRLKSELRAALETGGAVAAISVCNVSAPAIAAEQSEARGWDVGRTSLRYRNPDNAPDVWERAILEQFEARKQAGESPATLEFADTVVVEGRRLFRYMKAIPTAEVCLACHGSALAPEVDARLRALYPGDRARGFSVGDLRGAFTIAQPM